MQLDAESANDKRHRFKGDIERCLQDYRSERLQRIEQEDREIRATLACCESPAEQRFLIELIRLLEAWPVDIVQLAEIVGDIRARLHGRRDGTERFFVRIFLQKELDVDLEDIDFDPLRGARKYRPDFLIELERQEGVHRQFGANDDAEGYVPEIHLRLIVEVDGHDYHERTKEQARYDRLRDRLLTHAGFVVLRYTASEVYHEAELLARETKAFLERQALEIVKRNGP